MKIKHILFAVITGLLLTAGFARAAESFDLVSKSTLVQQTVNIVPGVPCTIEH
jgi:type 1 fimbria pilin